MPGGAEAARLYDTFAPSLFRYALMILASREAAEDVIQQVFLAVLARRGAAVEDEEHYLRRSVRNACYSALRHHRVRETPDLDPELLEAAGSGVSQEERLALADAIRRLPPDQREAIHLHAFEGCTFKEAAAIAGESPNTMASRYRYAMEKIRMTLTGEAR
jgi:RNA polymerase sigma-70 factor (ECF subfamily)